MDSLRGSQRFHHATPSEKGFRRVSKIGFQGGSFYLFCFSVRFRPPPPIHIYRDPFFCPKCIKNAWDCSGDRFLAQKTWIDFYPKIAVRIFHFIKEKFFPFKLKYDSHRGFVNVVNVADPYVVQKALRTQVLLMLLMLLIFFGIYSSDFIVFYVTITEITPTRFF